MKRPRLKYLRVMEPHTLELTYVDGSVHHVACMPLIAESPGLRPLIDPEAFAKATLIEGEGWAVHWQDLDIQIGADTLWLDAQAQAAEDENARTFMRWRARHNLSLSQAAQALGVTRRTISAYGTGERAVPRIVALACKGWESEQHGHATTRPDGRRTHRVEEFHP